MHGGTNTTLLHIHAFPLVDSNEGYSFREYDAYATKSLFGSDSYRSTGV